MDGSIIMSIVKSAVGLFENGTSVNIFLSGEINELKEEKSTVQYENLEKIGPFQTYRER